MKEYIYQHRKTGEILVSTEKVEDPEFEFLYEIEVGTYGGRRATRRTDTGNSQKT
mgnify:CR=1 FL=1